jgi:hypothetical protein
MSAVPPLLEEKLTPAPDRVRAIATGKHGQGHRRVDNVMTVELPADTIPLINCPVR